MRRPVAAVLLLASLACSGAAPTAPNVEHPLNIAVTNDGLRLTNESDAPLFYQSFEKVWGTTGLFIWGPCVQPTTCPVVPPHGTTTVPYSAIGGYTTDARQALVYFWELTPAGSGKYDPTNLRSTVVDL